jgi:hypothetical protein
MTVMQKSYGVVWQAGEGPPAVGRLAVLPLALQLDGLVDGEQLRETVPYESLSEARIGRDAHERIGGRPTVVLERRSGPLLLVSTVAQPSLVGEIVEGLAALQLGSRATRRTAVVLPLRPESRDAVQELVVDGPPFDPRAIPGLVRHEVFVTPREAVFVFETDTGEDTLESLLEDPTIWRAAAGWRDHLAGPPRLAEAEYVWSQGTARVDPAIAPR